MKKRHVASARLNARETLKMLNIRVGASIGDLTTDQLVLLIKEADRIKFQKPNATGGRAFHLHAQLQRQAKAEPD